MLLNEGIVGIEGQTVLEVNLSKRTKTHVVGLLVSVASGFAETDELTAIILLAIFVGDVAVRAKEWTPAPYILVRTLTLHVRIVKRTVVVVGAHTHLQPVGSLGRYVGSHVIVLNLVRIEVHQVLALVVVSTDVEVGLTRNTWNREVVVLWWSGVVENDTRNIPVSIVAILVIVVAEHHFAVTALSVAMLLDPVVHTGLELFAVEIHTKQFTSITLAAVSVDEGLNLSRNVRIFWSAGCLAPSKVVLVRNLHMVLLLTSLGGNQNHTESSASTIDRAWCSILKHWNAFNVVAVDKWEVVNRHTVHDVERWWYTTVWEGTNTTNHNASVVADATAGVKNSQTWHSTLKGFCHVGFTLWTEVFAHVHTGYSTSKVGFALLAITNHYHFIEQSLVFTEDHAASFWSFQCHSLKAYWANFQLSIFISFYAEHTVQVCSGTTHSSNYLNACTDNGFTILVNNSTFHMSGLSRDSLWYRGCKWGGHICTRKEKSANEGNLFFHTLVVFVNDFSLLKKMNISSFCVKC